MPLKTISFPPIQMGLRKDALELLLHTSVALEVPDSMWNMDSYSDLVNAVQDDQLWIARHGSSYFNVVLRKGTSQLSALERVMAADWIESHEVRTSLKCIPGPLT